MPLRLHPDVAATDTDDGTVLLHQRTGRYYQLNTTGSTVLQHLLDGHTPEAITADLADRHGKDQRQIERDVAAVIDQLRTAHLVVEL